MIRSRRGLVLLAAARALLPPICLILMGWLLPSALGLRAATTTYAVLWIVGKLSLVLGVVIGGAFAWRGARNWVRPVLLGAFVRAVLLVACVPWIMHAVEETMWNAGASVSGEPWHDLPTPLPTLVLAWIGVIGWLSTLVADVVGASRGPPHSNAVA